jgi:hypothetical protein
MGTQRIIMGMSEDKPPIFFIAGCAPEEQEKVYASMARSCNVHVPGTGQRLLSAQPSPRWRRMVCHGRQDADRSPSGLERPHEDRRDSAMASGHLSTGPTCLSPCCP